LAVVPTYNEAGSVAELARRALAADGRLQLLVVDDGSPDGTAALVKRLQAGEPRLHLLERAAKQGLGAAYRAGFDWGLSRGYDVLLEMDADLSHPPERIPALLDACGRPTWPSAPGTCRAAARSTGAGPGRR
jgi:glycosyltransferase involved in cell wall biosynthesis